MLADRRKKWPRLEGFSLLELLAVVTIIGIIAVVIVPRIGGSTNKAKVECSNQYRGDLNTAIEKYFFENGVFPPDLDTLYTDGFYPEPIPNDPVTNVPFTIDSVTNRVKK